MRFTLRWLRTQVRMLHRADRTQRLEERLSRGAAPPGSRWRRWVFGTTLPAAAAAIVLFVVSAGAIVTGSPSNFESNDGNMTVQTATHADWNCFANGNSTGFASGITVGSACFSPLNFRDASAKAADGAGETELQSGSKFDDQCPGLNTGHNPPKDEFQATAEYSDVNTSTRDTYFYGASIRPTTNGNSTGNLELNQIAGNGTTQHGCRSSGDRLIAFDFLNGGTSLSFHVLTYITSLSDTAGGNNEGGVTGCLVKSGSPPCWGAKVITPDSSEFDGAVNTEKAIPAKENGINGTELPALAFNEMGVNLTRVLGLSGKCFSFPQQVWESRSSGSSFSSNPQDIEFQAVEIKSCGEIKIIKQSDPRGKNQNFTFTSNIASPGTSSPPTPNCTQSPSNPSSFTLNDSGNTSKTLGSTDPAQNSTGNTQDCTNVIQGGYTVSEGTEPGGFTFEKVTCTADSSSGSSVSTSSKTATITLKPGGVVTCLYVNQLNTATLATQVSNAGPVFPAVAVHDTATVTGNQTADTPSGTVTFYLCGPIATGSCDGTTNVGTEIGTGLLSGSGAAASASSPDVNTSASPLAPGRYCFRATWPGETNYPGQLAEFGGSGGTNECFTVEKIPTETVTTPSVGSGATITFGSSVTDHALVTATRTGDGTPTGTVTFFVCEPSQTSGGACPASNGTQVGSSGITTTAVANSSPPASSADSSAITANKTGTWCFRAVYAPGGANGSNYTGSSDATSDECFTVKDETTSSSEQTWKPNDTATVASKNGAPLNGTLSVQLYTGDNCGATSGSAVSGQLFSKALTGGSSTATLTTSNTTFTVSASESVSWQVVFSSTDPNVEGSSHCEKTSLTVTN